MLRDRITGSELGDVVAVAIPDPVFAVVDDLRMRALAGVRDSAERTRITRLWNRIAQDVVTGGDPAEWQRILGESDYPHLARVAPTPADAGRLGARGLVASAAELPALWASPFADLLPEALAHTLDLDLRLVQPDPQSPGNTFVNTLNPGGRSGTLHLGYNGTDHFDALVPASAPLPPAQDPDTTGDPVTTPEPDDSPVFGEWLRSMGGITDLDGTDDDAPDRGDRVPLETQLERHRPARLMTGQDARPPGPAPRTVTFDDGSRIPATLIDPDADPGDGTPGSRTDGAGRNRPAGLFTGLGKTTLRSPEQVAEEILGGLPPKLRAQFDEADLLRLLTEQPGAFTAPRGARFVGREKSGVGHELTVEAIPYHRWERFSDVDGGTVRLDTMRRGQAGTGGGRSVGFGRRIAGGLSMGPPLNWLLKLGFSLGWTRRTDYTQGTQAYNQSEWRAHEGSHLHLDDVHYRVRVDRVTEAPAATGSPAPTGNSGTEDVPSGPRLAALAGAHRRVRHARRAELAAAGRPDRALQGAPPGTEDAHLPGRRRAAHDRHHRAAPDGPARRSRTRDIRCTAREFSAPHTGLLRPPRQAPRPVRPVRGAGHRAGADPRQRAASAGAPHRGAVGAAPGHPGRGVREGGAARPHPDHVPERAGARPRHPPGVPGHLRAELHPHAARRPTYASRAVR